MNHSKKIPTQHLKIRVKLVFIDPAAKNGDREAQNLLQPKQKSAGASGYDLVAANTTVITLKKGACKKVPTGIAIELPDGYEAQIRPRSGLAFKHQITLLNSPGTIDADYRGEIAVLMVNHGQEDFIVRRGMRIAQMVIAEVPKSQLYVGTELSPTTRGSAGFGSTGA